MVSAAFRSIFALADPDDVRARYDEVTDTLTARFPKAAESLRDARTDVLAFAAFPRDHWRNACSIASGALVFDEGAGVSGMTPLASAFVASASQCLPGDLRVAAVA